MRPAYQIEEAPVYRVIVPSHIPFAMLLIFCSVAVVFNVLIWTFRDLGSDGPGIGFRLAARISGVCAVALLLWTFLGCEVISFEGSELVLRYEILGFGFSREFDRTEVRNLRPRLASKNQTFRDRIYDHIAFDYGARTFTFGTLEPTEAVRLADQVTQRFSELRPVQPVVINSF